MAVEPFPLDPATWMTLSRFRSLAYQYKDHCLTLQLDRERYLVAQHGEQCAHLWQARFIAQSFFVQVFDYRGITWQPPPYDILGQLWEPSNTLDNTT